MTFEIKHRLTRKVLFTAEVSSLRLAVEAAVKARANLAGAKLTGANLSGAELTGAELSGAELSGAKLTGAELSGAKLVGANLTGAKLTDANLTDANLTDAKLTDANLTDANLRGAKLSGVDLAVAASCESEIDRTPNVEKIADAVAAEQDRCVRSGVAWLLSWIAEHQEYWPPPMREDIGRHLADAIRKPSAVREAMEQAIEQADEKATGVGTSQPSTKADAAIEKLRQDRRLTREELDRPTMSESDDGQMEEPHVDEENTGYGPKYHTGKPCVEVGCDEPAGTAWGPHWCADCDRARRERISRNLKKIMAEFPQRENG